MSKEVIWTNYGLDGAGCCLLLKWLRGNNIEIQYTTPRKFRDDFLKWQLENGTTKYSRIYITSIDLSKCLDVADKSNCVIIDTHKSHAERKHLYTDAKTAIAETSSTTRLIFRLFKNELLKILTPKQIKLISLIDDYISGKNKFKESNFLNALYWGVSADRLIQFIKQFDNGYNGFNQQQQNVINLHFKRISKTVSELDIFQGILPIKGKKYKIVSTFAENYFPEISNHLIDVYNVDIVMVVNIGLKTVYMQQRVTSDAPLHLIAEKLTEGGGTQRYAGGNLTSKFIEFTKTLQKIW
jgi:hypothetical protein